MNAPTVPTPGRRFGCGERAEMDPCVQSFSPAGGVANAEKSSQHQDWYVEYREKVSDAIAPFFCMTGYEKS